MLLPSKDRGTVFIFDKLETGVDQARVIKSFAGSMAKSYSPEQAIGRVKRLVFIDGILISSLPYIVVASQVDYTQLTLDQPVCKYPGLQIPSPWKFPPAGLSSKRGATSMPPLPLASLPQDHMFTARPHGRSAGHSVVASIAASVPGDSVAGDSVAGSGRKFRTNNTPVATNRPPTA